ncbi:L-serine ammonia-lyase [Pleionea sp. CnH1-48]|uniref:L-serine ammonia-lyase n=1 Tax=Pleionea sp. CnH1-48 TaxID=2954494 RepID=UPI0020969327|nr:L-serine ammonia-lyase [Pleionea sp. CnH1-48]MCO7223598.1 L-serine ammonia-lyase [Pleionea sp. CnH1-48]
MAISTFELFTIGIGPSSSHTVGPMRAARQFVLDLKTQQLLASCARVKSDLYGSLGQTGKGHGSDVACLLGLEGERPSLLDPDTVPDRLERIRGQKTLMVNGEQAVVYNEKKDLIFHRRETLPMHANGMRFSAFDANGDILLEKVYYSVGGGFVVSDNKDADEPFVEDQTQLKYPFKTGNELLTLTQETGLSISSIMLENEQAWRSERQVREGLVHIWETMEQCVLRGCQREGILPGGLKVKRRAPSLYRKLKATQGNTDELSVMDWVNLYALAVNEENAAGGRVVTAPTNGAAGIIPAVLYYFVQHYSSGEIDQDAIVRFLLTASAVGILYKENASISGAEVGCQGEVGVACSMAAAALTEVMGGTPEQVENAAEIGMEHNLGLTCDPVGGLVQVPCIERNAMGSIKAINAARLAMRGDGSHKVSLDKVIKTMRETGADMKTKYKETARGGLAVNIIEC